MASNKTNLKYDNICVNSFNCRGIRDKKKRDSVFHWLTTKHLGIAMLQETHSMATDELEWQKEWKGDIYYSHGTNQSKGVAILLPNKINDRIKCLNIEKDRDGRLLILDCEIDNNPLLLINVYAPTKDMGNQQLLFSENLKSKLEKHGDKNVIIGGDFNTYLNPKVDKKGGTDEKISKYAVNILSIMEEYNLIDIYRARHPEERKFTRRENSKSGLIHSRLDYFLISNCISSQVIKTFIDTGFKSDHSIVKLKVQFLNSQKRGMSYWKFNNKLLNDKTYINLIKEELQNISSCDYFKNKNLQWDFVKCQIRTITIAYSKTKCKEAKEKEKKVKTELEKLEQKIIGCSNETILLDYFKMKEQWEQIEMSKAEGAIMRSRTQWVEMGEKNTKYFLNLEKRNYNQKYIKKLICNEETITDPFEILNEEKKFYENLYTSKVKTKGKNIDSFLSKINVPQLSDTEKTVCDSPLCMAEIASALKELKNDKTPGNDGFTTNFYKFFWPDIKNLLFATYNYSYQMELLTDDQRRSILNLIPKPDKDLRLLKNWRPVSILNTDYKILTKALANRLQLVLPNLIDNDQAGYIKNRYIGENVRIIEDVMTYTNLKNLTGYIVLLDFEKAFDSIEWSYLFKTLETFNFGPNFQKWIRILYTNIESTVSNNGYFSSYFKLSRGIRQGCPISALLFLLVAETMACSVRNNELIKGISIENEIFKICQLADDTTIFVKDLQSIETLMTFLQRFYEYTGLKINIDKSQVVPIGKVKLQNLKLPISIKKMAVNNKGFKTLGVWFSYDIQEAISLNFNEKIEKIEKILNIWKTRKLSWKGKILILKSLILPQITYLLSVCYCPDRILMKIDHILMEFFWDKKVAKVKKKTLIGTFDKGGLKMPEIFAINTVSKIKWIKKLLLITNGKWKLLTWYLLNIPKNKIKNKLPLSLRFKSLSPFHRQIFDSWEKFHGVEPKNVNEISQEFIFNNKFVCSGGEPLNMKTLGITEKKLEELTVGNIVSNIGNVFTFKQFCQTHDANIQLLTYNKLITSIPRKWKEILRNNDFKVINRNNLPKISVKGQLKDLTQINDKVLYWISINDQLQEPVALEKWIESYPFLEIAPWEKIFKLSHLIVKEPYLQSFQYKIINRLTNCKQNLFKWKIVDSPICYYCGQNDTIEHHFFWCDTCIKFWDTFRKWTGQILEIEQKKYTVCEILFGYDLNESKLSIINLVHNVLILQGKWYINTSKFNEKLLNFRCYEKLIKSKFEMYALLPTYSAEIKQLFTKVAMHLSQ